MSELGTLSEARQFMDDIIAGKVDPDKVRELLTKAEYYGRMRNRLTMTGNATVKKANVL